MNNISNLLVTGASDDTAVTAPAGCPDDTTVEMTGDAQTGTQLEWS